MSGQHPNDGDIFKRPLSRSGHRPSSSSSSSSSGGIGSGWLPPPVTTHIGSGPNSLAYTGSDLFKYTSEAMSPSSRGLPGRGRIPSGLTSIDPSLTLPPIRDPRYLQNPPPPPPGRPSLDRNLASYPSGGASFPSFSSSLDRDRQMMPPPRVPSRGRGLSTSGMMYSTSGPIPPLHSMDDPISSLPPLRSRRSSAMDLDLPPLDLPPIRSSLSGLPPLSSSLSSSSSSRGSLSPSSLSSSGLPSLSEGTSRRGRRPNSSLTPATDPGREDEIVSSSRSAAGGTGESHASRGLRKFSKRTTFSQYQLGLMEQLWAKTEYPSVDEVDRCADMCNLSAKQIRTWFGNTRQARLAGTRKEARQAGAALAVAASPRRGRPSMDKLPPLGMHRPATTAPGAVGSASRGSFVPLGSGPSSSSYGGRSSLPSSAGDLGGLSMFPPPPGSPSGRGRASDLSGGLPPLPESSRSRRNSFSGSFPGGLPQLPPGRGAPRGGPSGYGGQY